MGLADKPAGCCLHGLAARVMIDLCSREAGRVAETASVLAPRLGPMSLGQACAP
jgi:hypothetical protein